MPTGVLTTFPAICILLFITEHSILLELIRLQQDPDHDLKSLQRNPAAGTSVGALQSPCDKVRLADGRVGLHKPRVVVPVFISASRRGLSVGVVRRERGGSTLGQRQAGV